MSWLIRVERNILGMVLITNATALRAHVGNNNNLIELKMRHQPTSLALPNKICFAVQLRHELKRSSDNRLRGSVKYTTTQCLLSTLQPQV